ncbi:unnamed protein product [Diamesa hyperborea]
MNEDKIKSSSNKVTHRDLILIFLSLPVSLIIWGGHYFISSFTNSNGKFLFTYRFIIYSMRFITLLNDTEFILSPLRAFLSTLVPFFLGIYGYKRKSINKSGAFSGVIVALFLTIASPVYMVTLGAFFFSSSRITKYRSDVKEKIEKDFKVGGQRNWVQVLCNGGVATVFAIFHLIECGIGENPIDYQNFYVSSWLGVGIMTSFAMANGDTWASELGILSKSDPVLITTLKRVPRGTNGGVSLLGLIVSFLGGIFIGVFYYIATIVFVDNQSLEVSPAQWPIIILGGIAGLLGSLIDSVLGATFQFSGQTVEGFIVEVPGEKVKKISGTFRLLNNHSVNLISCILTSFIISTISVKFWSLFQVSVS